MKQILLQFSMLILLTVVQEGNTVLWDKADYSAYTNAYSLFLRNYYSTMNNNLYNTLDSYVATFQSLFASMTNQIATVAYYRHEEVNTTQAIEDYTKSVYDVYSEKVDTALSVLGVFSSNLVYLANFIATVENTDALIFVNIRSSLSPSLDSCVYNHILTYLASLSQGFNLVNTCYLIFGSNSQQVATDLNTQILALTNAVNTFNSKIYGCAYVTNYGSAPQCVQYMITNFAPNFVDYLDKIVAVTKDYKMTSFENCAISSIAGTATSSVRNATSNYIRCLKPNFSYP